MARKRWTRQTEENPSLDRLREKRKWQIALRRYLTEENPSAAYAPYFGLDISHFRNWIEIQFEPGMSWADFGARWQFDHIIPLACFNTENEEELRLAWNFLNIRVHITDKEEEKHAYATLIRARDYFQGLLEKTGWPICQSFLDKIALLEKTEGIPMEKRVEFLQKNKTWTEQIPLLSAYELERLNRGYSLEEIRKEQEFLKNIGPRP